MGLDTDYLNADPLYLRARRMGNRHDRPPFEIVGGSGWHPLVIVSIWLVVIMSCLLGAAIFASTLHP